MDIDFMKSTNQHQMEMMVMQMDKLPEFDLPLPDFGLHPGSTTIPIDDNHLPGSLNPNLSTISFSDGVDDGRWKLHGFPAEEAQKRNSMAAMREMIFRIAAMQPIHIDPESVKPPKRRNVKISTDPQSVAARHRRERISERIRILQRLVPGGTKMDTASMLDEAIHYVKFLKYQVQSLERVAAGGIGFPVAMSSGSFGPGTGKGYHPGSHS